MEKQTAILDRIKYQKDGFIIAEFKQPSEFLANKFTALGTIMPAKQGMTYEMLGRWKPNTFAGKTIDQFHIQSARMIAPQDTRGIYLYLVKTTSSIGPAIGNRLIDLYGDKTLEILKSDPSRAAKEIKGLTEARAEVIAEQLAENDEIESVMVELESLIGGQEGLPKSVIPNLIKSYGMAGPDKLRRNPYILINFRGVGFLSADRVAMEVFNVKPDSVFRQAACVEYVIENIRREGHVWADESIVRIRVQNEINVADMVPGIERLIEDMVVIRDGSYLAFRHDSDNERLIAARIGLMSQYVFEGEEIDYDDI